MKLKLDGVCECITVKCLDREMATARLIWDRGIQDYPVAAKDMQWSEEGRDGSGKKRRCPPDHEGNDPAG